MSENNIKDVIIVGGGPAGLAAAVYTGRDRFSTLILEKMTVGGQMFTTWDVENYPGFEEITGPDLSGKFENHARKFGAQFEMMAEVTDIVKGDDGIFTITTTEEEYKARTVLVATGATWNHLGIPGEEELGGRGVSYCATCDGAFFKNMEIMVVGGGNTALDEGLFLTKFASKVTLIHRRDELRGDKILQERFLAHEKTEILWSTIPEEIIGENGVEKVRVKNVKTGESYDVEVRGVFIFIGNTPNTELFKGKLEMDQWGGIKVDNFGSTSVEGIFAAGDCIADAPRQIAVSVGDGVRAALGIKAYLEKSH